MSSDSSANNGPIEDRYAFFLDFENDLLNKITLCSDVCEKEQLTWKLATFYLETARPDKAIFHLQWILNSTQNDESKKDSLRTLGFLTGSEERTIPVSYECFDLPEVLWQMANVFLGKGNQQPGVQCLLRLLDISSDRERRAECFLLLGAECEKADDYGAAARFYLQGMECVPRGTSTRYFLHNNLGYSLNQLGVFVEGEKYCRTAIEIDPQRHNSYKNLGLALQGQGIYPEAADCFTRAAFICPTDSRAIGHLEEILANHQDEVEREIPDVAEHLAAAIDARKKMMQ
jgi:tetratricopeptide (TPR) repeat protein